MSSPNFQASVSKSERTRLVSMAYGYLGSLAESEDIVQEAMLRLLQEDRAQIRNVAAWLTTVVARLAIDRLRSAQHRREVYFGEWLPEPVFHAPTAEQDAITRSKLSVGLLYLLEGLEPEQRIVFVLREVFQHSYDSIAEVAGKSEAGCRQLMVRARAALERAKATPPVAKIVADGVVNRFIEALAQGDEGALLGILAPDAVLVADGGGKVRSVLKPIYGADKIARFFRGIRPKHRFEWRAATVNSGPGMLTYQDGKLGGVTQIEIRDGKVAAIYAVSNPDKIGVRKS
ncbi:MAG: RNA polymerase sigma factor SigJ [Candidatus Solibacter sp.]